VINGVYLFSLIMGFLLYKIVILPFTFVYKTLSAVEDNVTNGLMGILGFFAFFIGSVIHIILKLVEPNH
jgi:hypothetical protein